MENNVLLFTILIIDSFVALFLLRKDNKVCKLDFILVRDIPDSNLTSY